ncbi:MAG: class I SAM-dependent methyltransferase [Neomegalonema sp.]|nr:class I SAM-dependent methyltransferase [Neomegalonema sp.]
MSDFPDDGGWARSAEAWIADMGEHGDFGRACVLDRPMLARIDAHSYRRALDVGCGEGRFSRMLRARGIDTIGVDPTARLIEEARRRDPEGDYREGNGEKLAFDDNSFDLVVCCMVLIDIPDYRAAIDEAARVLAPGGALLIANINSFISAGADRGWVAKPDGSFDYYPISGYFGERPILGEWRGISIVNHHRPLDAYMSALIGAGLQLAHFEEPRAHSGPAARQARYNQAPWFLIMEWRKPA